MRCYCNLFAGMKKMFQDEGNDVTPEDFGEGYTLFAYDLTPGVCDSPHFWYQRQPMCGDALQPT